MVGCGSVQAEHVGRHTVSGEQPSGRPEAICSHCISDFLGDFGYQPSSLVPTRFCTGSGVSRYPHRCSAVRDGASSRQHAGRREPWITAALGFAGTRQSDHHPGVSFPPLPPRLSTPPHLDCCTCATLLVRTKSDTWLRPISVSPAPVPPIPPPFDVGPCLGTYPQIA